MQTSAKEPLSPTDYYRLPWTLTDNVLGWLEPTKRCNLYCEGCYSRNDPRSDKTLAAGARPTSRSSPASDGWTRSRSPVAIR